MPSRQKSAARHSGASVPSGWLPGARSSSTLGRVVRPAASPETFFVSSLGCSPRLSPIPRALPAP
eukprot:1058435-Pyramimonas_sp.AAC.1